MSLLTLYKINKISIVIYKIIILKNLGVVGVVMEITEEMKGTHL